MIGQAEGILMEQLGISTDEAFRVLQQASKRTNRKLREVAETLIETRRLPGMDGGRKPPRTRH
jgi:AmiR/NasT family two-component response regulator